MYIGICIQKETIKNMDQMNDLNKTIKEYTYNYSKPLIYDDINKNYFLAYLLRDVDFSILVNPNEKLKIYVIQYKDKNIFLKLNENNSTPNHSLDMIDIIGNYNISIKNMEITDDTTEYIKSKLFFELDSTFDLSVEFTVFYRKNEEDYIMSNP
jgi:hypothetical protein